MRVAVTQFATVENPQDNLTTCIQLINEAAACKPDLIVFPQYCNTHFSNSSPYHASESITYNDHNQSWQNALATNGSFLNEIGQLANKLSCYININVTLRQNESRNHNDGAIKSDISVTSCLFSPQGELVHQQHKTALTVQEKQFFVNYDNTAEVVSTPLANLGLISGHDSLCFNTARRLSLAGAQILCNAMDHGSLDQTEFHDPTRANENNVFVVSANKVNLDGQPINQSQIISPQGRVLAKVDTNKNGFCYTDIEIENSGFTNKCRPDGTSVLTQQSNVKAIEPTTQALISNPAQSINTPKTTNVAIFATYKSNEEAINDVCHYIENNLSDIIQLPELFFIDDKSITHNIEERQKIADLSQQVINLVSAELRPFQYLCTSLIIDDTHQAVIINQHGLFASQQQMHYCERYQWTMLSNKLNIIDLPLEQGSLKLAMLSADDANIPEIINTAALNAINVLLVPFDIQEPNEVKYNFISRAIEHNICIVAASREKSFSDNLSSVNTSNSPFAKNKIKVQKSTGLIINLPIKQGVIAHWKTRKFSGYINEPIIKAQFGKITKAVIHPIATGYNPSNLVN